MQITNCRSASINVSAGGDTVVIAAPGNTNLDPGNTFQSGGAKTGTQVGSITVWQLQLESAGATVMQFKSGSSLIGGPFTFTGAGSTATLEASGVPWVKCAAGQALSINLGTGVAVTGNIQYTLG